MADVATEEVEEPPKPRIESVYLHVQVGNEEAKRFWEKFGFEVKVSFRFLFPFLSLPRIPFHIFHPPSLAPRRAGTDRVFALQDTISNYYRKIEPRDAWLLERKIEPVSAASSS